MNQSKSVTNVVSLDDDLTVEAYLKLKLKETIEVFFVASFGTRIRQTQVVQDFRRHSESLCNQLKEQYQIESKNILAMVAKEMPPKC
jgi:hypothetical protein